MVADGASWCTVQGLVGRELLIGPRQQEIVGGCGHLLTATAHDLRCPAPLPRTVAPRRFDPAGCEV